MIKIASSISDENLYYLDLSPEEALISAYFYKNNLMSFLHDEKERDKVRGEILRGRRFLRLGNLYVSLKNS